jgi:signal transduction histidine kinase
MTRVYLNKNPKELFWLFFLAIPYLIWMYSIVTELNKKIPKSQRLNEKVFIAFMVYAIAYIPICIFLLLFTNVDIHDMQPFHFIAMFCTFLLMIFTAITITRFEKAEKFDQSNWVELFFGIWFYFIGVWHIQPKLNNYIKRIE